MTDKPILSEVEERNARDAEREARKQRGESGFMDVAKFNELEAADFGGNQPLLLDGTRRMTTTVNPGPMTRAKVEAVADWLGTVPGINYLKWQAETAVALRKFAADEFPDGDPND